MTAAHLRHRVELQRPKSEKGQDGERSNQWECVATMWAGIIPKKGDERERSGAQQQTITHDIKIRFRNGITAKMRFNYRGRVFNIMGAPVDQYEKHRFLLIPVEEVF